MRKDHEELNKKRTSSVKKSVKKTTGEVQKKKSLGATKKVTKDAAKETTKRTVKSSPKTTTNRRKTGTSVRKNSKSKSSGNVLNSIVTALKKMNLGQDFRPSMIKKYAHVFIFPVVMVYFELILRLCSGTSVFSHIIYPVLFGLAGGFLLSFFTVLFRRNINRIITIVLLFGMGLLFTTECLIKKSFQWYLPLNGVFARAGDIAGNYLGEALMSIITGIPAIVLFFMPGIAYVLVGKVYFPAKRFKAKMALRYVVYSAMFMLVAVVLSNVGSSAAKYKSQYKFDTATEYFGLMTALRLETKYSLLGNSAAEGFVIEDDYEQVTETTVIAESEEVEETKVYGKNEMELPLDEVTKTTTNDTIKDLNKYVASLTPSSQNEYTGIFKGKNLILITAEAFSHVVVHEELTPTLYRMTHNGFYFSDYYQPTWGGSTSTGEYSFLMGIVPRKADQSMFETRDKNLYFTLGNQLQREGYYSRSYHNGQYEFYDRDQTHENIGYSEFIALENGLRDLTGAKYPDDQTMFDYTLENYMDKQPFSIYYMTISGHSVYAADHAYTKENIDYVRSVLGDQYKDTTLYYFCYQMELEQALTSMIAKLEEAGIADDTVICLTSDHFPYGLRDSATFGNSENYVYDLYGYEYEYNWEQDPNSWILWSGCLENEYKDMVCEISTPTYSLDIVPTLSNLFGLEYDSRLLVGRDVFSDQEPLVIWNNYSWVTDKGKYDANEDKFYPAEGVTEDTAYIERINKIVANKIAFSANAIDNDYYRELFGEDTAK